MQPGWASRTKRPSSPSHHLKKMSVPLSLGMSFYSLLMSVTVPRRTAELRSESRPATETTARTTAERSLLAKSWRSAFSSAAASWVESVMSLHGAKRGAVD
jgi:hypothetical protein